MLIAGLDVGTTKVCCFLARREGGEMRVVGIGHQVAKGLKAGTVVDMEAAEASVRAAVDAAERMAGDTVREVFLTLTAGQPVSHTVRIEVALAGHPVDDNDLRRALDQGRASDFGERQVIHAIPVGYTIDGTAGIRDPRGMFGDRLGVTLHVVTAQPGPVRNLITCVERCHLKIAGLVAAPYASGLSTLVEDETDLGVTIIDLGGGTTTLAIFYDGSLVHTDSIPIGGGHITTDIARGLSTPLAHAERMKTLYGSVLSGKGDENEIIDVPQVGESEHLNPNHVSRSILFGIIKPRAEEMFEMVRERLKASGFDKLAGRRVVLVGGGSQLQGIRELAARILDKQVRLGRPLRMAGLAEATGGPAFAACAGVLAYADNVQTEAPARLPKSSSAGLARLGQWLRVVF